MGLKVVRTSINILTCFVMKSGMMLLDLWYPNGAKLVRFLSHVSVLAPKSNIIHPKIDSKRHQDNDRFLDRFVRHLGFILGAKLGPCWLLFRLNRRDEVRNKPSEFGTKVNEFRNKAKRVRE